MAFNKLANDKLFLAASVLLSYLNGYALRWSADKTLNKLRQEFRAITDRLDNVEMKLEKVTGKLRDDDGNWITEIALEDVDQIARLAVVYAYLKQALGVVDEATPNSWENYERKNLAARFLK